MRLFVSLLLILSVVTALAQEPNFWHVLAEVGFKKSKISEGEMEVPVFSNNLKRYNGKKIKLKGFVIPVSETGDESKFMLSSLPLMFATSAERPDRKLSWKLKLIRKLSSLRKLSGWKEFCFLMRKIPIITFIF